MQHLSTFLCFLHLFFICAFNSVTVQKHEVFIQTHGIIKKWGNLQTSFPLTLRVSWQKQEILLTDQHVQCTTEATNSWYKPSSNVNDSYKPSLLQLVQLWPSSIVSDGRTQSCAETTTPGLFWTNTMGTVCSASCTEHTGIYIHCSSYRCYYLNNHGQKDKIHPKYRNMDEQRGEIPSQSITLRSPQPAVLPGQVKKKNLSPGSVWRITLTAMIPGACGKASQPLTDHKGTTLWPKKSALLLPTFTPVTTLHLRK